MTTTYLFYIDESGQREYGIKTSRYFALCGLGIPVETWQLLNTNVYSLKQSYFGAPTVEIKSSWLRQPLSAGARYIEPYHLSREALRECVSRLYDLLDNPAVVLFASVIDKVQMTDKYVAPQSPSSLAYRLLFERFQQFLESQGEGSHGLVIFDRIHDANFREQGYENLLAQQHLRYLQQGTEFVEISNIVEGLLFISSAVNNFIQLADLCAYDVFRQFKEHGSEWDAPQGEQWPLYGYLKRIVHRFYRGPGGLLAGYGLKKYPDFAKLGLQKVNWTLRGDEVSGWAVCQATSRRLREWEAPYE